MSNLTKVYLNVQNVLSFLFPAQDVVPQALLDQYLSMTDPSRAQTVDTEIAKHCAYSLPGVALTLGRQNWHCLRETYETLASDMQVSESPRCSPVLAFQNLRDSLSCGVLGVAENHDKKKTKPKRRAQKPCSFSETLTYEEAAGVSFHR